MESINTVACGKAFLEILVQNYGESDTVLNEDHYFIAEYLLEKLQHWHTEFVFQEDFENDFGKNVRCFAIL